MLVHMLILESRSLIGRGQRESESFCESAEGLFWYELKSA